MSTLYTCECTDGKTVSGSSRWELAELKKAAPLELAEILTELKDFSRYYEATFYLPLNSLELEAAELERQFIKSKVLTAVSGTVTGIITVFWLIFALLPFMRFSGLTLIMAMLTFISILVFIPLLFRFSSAQDSYNKRLPRVTAKIENLTQRQEKEIFGTYLEYLIGGYLITPEYSLSEEALELMIQALSSRKASNISEAAVLCKKKFGKSPVPRLITSLRSVGDPAAAPKTAARKEPQKISLNQLENQGPDLRVVLQLSEYLHAAVKGYAAAQRAPQSDDQSVGATLTYEEEALVSEYRYLTDEERKRIRRIVHSFRTKQI